MNGAFEKKFFSYDNSFAVSGGRAFISGDSDIVWNDIKEPFFDIYGEEAEADERKSLPSDEEERAI